jgi:hypothetical protein
MGDASARSEAGGAGNAVADSSGNEHLVPVDDEVLSDLRHSLGNYFHKLYYWADYLKSGADDLGPDVAPVEMLDRTLQNLEGFLRVALEYFRRPDLSCVTLNGEELGRAVASVLRSAQADRGQVVAQPGVERWNVAVDPSLFSEALGIAAKQLRFASGDESTVLEGSVEPAPAAERLRLELRVAGSNAPARARRDLGLIEWAVAGRLLRAHGGSLEAINEDGLIAGCVIHVPAQAA